MGLPAHLQDATERGGGKVGFVGQFSPQFLLMMVGPEGLEPSTDGL